MPIANGAIKRDICNRNGAKLSYRECNITMMFTKSEYMWLNMVPDCKVVDPTSTAPVPESATLSRNVR